MPEPASPSASMTLTMNRCSESSSCPRFAVTKACVCSVFLCQMSCGLYVLCRRIHVRPSFVNSDHRRSPNGTYLPGQPPSILHTMSFSQAIQPGPVLPMKIEAPEHPFFPIHVTVHGYVPNTLPTAVLLITFFGSLAVIFAGSRYALRQRDPSLSSGDAWTASWFILCGFIHTFFEGTHGAITSLGPHLLSSALGETDTDHPTN